MDLHAYVNLGPARSSGLRQVRRCLLRLVRLLTAVGTGSRKKTRQKTTFIHRQLQYRPEHSDNNVTIFLHSHFRSVGWRDRGEFHDSLPVCKD